MIYRYVKKKKNVYQNVYGNLEGLKYFILLFFCGK